MEERIFVYSWVSLYDFLFVGSRKSFLVWSNLLASVNGIQSMNECVGLDSEELTV